MPKKRRAKGEGTLYKRADGYWVAAITVRRATGGRQHRRAFYGRTKSEVVCKIAEHREKHGGVVAGVSSYDLRALLTAWLAAAAGRRGAWAAATKDIYASAAAHVYSAEIADVRLDRLEALDLADFLAGLARAKIGEAMRAKVYRTLRAALGSATAKQHALRHNPMLDVDPVAEPKGDVRPATQAEVKRLVAAAANERLGSLFVVLVATGLRPGEAYALRWDAVDFAARVIHVRSTLSEIGGERALKRPKTEGSFRIVALGDVALAALRQRRAIAAKERHGSAYVWSQSDGEPLRRRGVERTWARIRAAAKLPAPLRIKDLRHTHASLLAEAGVHPVAVAQRLGHSSAKMTLDRYTHSYDDAGQKAAKQFDRLLSGKPSKTASHK